MKAFATAALSLLLTAGAAAKDLNPRLIPELGKAYGFIAGQNAALDRIEREFPQLNGELQIARAKFAARLGEAASIADLLRPRLKDKFTAFDDDLKAKLAAQAQNQALSLADAKGFLSLVNSRATGKTIPDDILKPLLVARYYGRPTAEFADGWRQSFETGGEGKALGVKIHVELPQSFLSKESSRPHIVRSFVSENGTGSETIMIQVHSSEVMVTQNDLDAEYGPDLAKEVAGPDGQVIEFGKFKHETYPGFWYQIVQNQERATIKMKVAMLFYMIFAGDKAIGLGCVTGTSDDSGADIRPAADALKPLCLQVLNTLVLPGAYR